MNELNRMILAVLGSVIIMLAGCAMGPSRLEADYGHSLNLAESQQILNPEAHMNLAPVVGFDGRAAAATIERYQASFEKPTPPPTFVIPIGTQR